MAQLLENQISYPMLGYFRSQHANQAWLTALVSLVDYASIVSLSSRGSLKLQADHTFAMGRHVLSDVVVIFGLEEACKKALSSRVPERCEDLRGLIVQRPGVLDSHTFSSSALAGKVASYEPQAAALSEYFLMSLPAAMPDRAVRNDWDSGVADRDETPFAVSDPFQDTM